MTALFRDTAPVLRVAIIDVGAVEVAACGLMESRGQRPAILWPSSASAHPFREWASLELTAEARLELRTATSRAEKVTSADAVMIAMPANGQRACFEAPAGRAWRFGVDPRLVADEIAA